MADETKLSFRELQDLKGNKPGINDEMKGKVETLLNQIETLNTELELSKQMVKDNFEQNEASKKELSDKIQSLITENSELGSKLKDAELKLSELQKATEAEDILKNSTVNIPDGTENKAPEKKAKK